MHELTIYHFMSDKLNLYSDIGNIIALRQRAKKRNIKVNVVEINETEGITFDECDIFFIGGGSDREQALATKELSKIKTPLKEAIEDGMPGLTICGGYQFLGKKYITPDGTELEGLGILDFYTESKTNRLTGDIVIESDTFGTIVGFENHGGRTYHDFGNRIVVIHMFQIVHVTIKKCKFKFNFLIFESCTSVEIINFIIFFDNYIF